MAVTFLTGYIGIFSVTNKNNRVLLISALEGAEHNVIRIPPGAYDSEILNAESKPIILIQACITREGNPFTVNPNYSTLICIKQIEPGRGWPISVEQDDVLRHLSGFKPIGKHEEYNLSDKPVDIKSCDYNFP